MGFWSAIGSAAGNAASSISLHDLTGGWSDMSSREHSAKFTADLGYRYSKKYAKWQALNIPSLSVQGLRNAGLNPILASGADSGGTINPSMPPSSGDSRIFEGLARKEYQAADANIENIKARTETERASAHAVMVNAETNKQNAVTNQWQMFDAKSIGAAGFNVQFLGKGFGGNGDYKVIHTLRVNKVTGEAYDALSGQKVRVISELPANSGKQASENATHNYFQYNNYYDNIKDSGKHFNLPR